MLATGPRARAGLLCAALCVALAGAACSGAPKIPHDFATDETAAEENAPLGGAALLDLKAQMQRAQRDLLHFHTTLESLHHRNDRKGARQLAAFVDAYMGLHLDRMLRGQWQSRHPELMALDANLRFMKADVLIRMRSAGRAQRVIDEIEERFAGREDMLVDYPVGEQSPLGKGLELLRDGKWRG